MASNTSKRLRLGLGLGPGLPIGLFGTCATLGLKLYSLPDEAHFGITWCITCKDIHLVPVKKLQRDFVLYAYFITQFTACLMALLKKITITHIDTLRIVKLVALAYTKF